MLQSINIEDILKGMDDLVGLAPYKETLREMARDLSISRRPVHYAFVGNPGRGKVAVARMMGRVLGRMGIAQRGLFVELDRDDMAGLSQEEALHKLALAMEKAKGGILFVDDAPEVYRLTGKKFEQMMEQTEVRVVLSGSKEEMDLLLEKAGCASEVARTLYFPDFTPDELVQVAEKMADEYQLTMTAGAREKLLQLLVQKKDRIGQLGNARYAKNLIDRAYRNAASRIMQGGNSDRLLPEDIEDVMPY